MRAAGLLFLALPLGLAALAGCLPEPGEPSSLVKSTRVLAVGSEPAEALPGQPVTLRLLLADPAAFPPSAEDIEWAFCTAPKPPVDNNVISDSCLSDGAEVVATGPGPVVAVLPADGCARFGPELPPARAGEPPARPREPDSTGGYYQPVRARVARQTAIGLVRIQCGLAGATSELAAAYRARYLPNHRPQLLRIELSDAADGRPLPADALPGSRPVRLRASFSADSAERFPVVAPELPTLPQTLIDQTESLQVAWFATFGSFELGHTVAPPGQTTVDNTWTLPPQPDPGTLGPGTIWPGMLWIVLRDSRGGLDWMELPVKVK